MPPPLVENFSAVTGRPTTNTTSVAVGPSTATLQQVPFRPMVHATVSDSVIAPKPFTGKSTDIDAESWLSYFTRYAVYRGLSDNDKLRLFCIMMHDGSADWLCTLKPEETASYDALIRAFKDNYFKSEQLKWKEASELWNQPQGATERVDDFVTRIRRAARRLNIPDDLLNFAVLNGLRGSIRSHVL